MAQTSPRPSRILAPPVPVKGMLRTIHRPSNFKSPNRPQGFDPSETMGMGLASPLSAAEANKILGNRALGGPEAVDDIQLESDYPCTICSLFIEEGKVLEFDGLFCHEACFVCGNCKKPCDLEEFYHDTVSIFCPDCKTHLRPRCHYCAKFLTKTLLRDNVTLEPFHEECYPKWCAEMAAEEEKSQRDTQSARTTEEVPTLAEFAAGKKAGIGSGDSLSPVSSPWDLRAGPSDQPDITPVDGGQIKGLVRQFKREIIPEAPRTVSISQSHKESAAPPKRLTTTLGPPPADSANPKLGQTFTDQRASRLLNDLWTSVASTGSTSPEDVEAPAVPDYSKTQKKDGPTLLDGVDVQKYGGGTNKTGLKQPLLNEGQEKKKPAAAPKAQKSSSSSADEGFSVGCSIQRNWKMIAVAIFGFLVLVAGVIMVPLAGGGLGLSVVGYVCIGVGALMIIVTTALTRFWRRVFP